METVYLETSLVSYLVSRPSRDLIVAGHQQLTREWWERRRAKFACFISDVVLDEAREGDAEQAALRLRALEGIPRLAATPAGERLAAAFLEGTLPLKAARDAAHLAIAAVGGVKYLLTWNCNHLANAQILDRLEPVAAAGGFKLPRVCTPEELMGVSLYE
ncbi:MAG: type II toxin-antitoxin system VapC family toxin [Limisphaerales bacterium]